MKVYDVKIRLDKIKPLYWRDVFIPSGITFDDLYFIAQSLYGFQHLHDYKFIIKEDDIVIEGLENGNIPLVFLREEYEEDDIISFKINWANLFIIDDYFDKYNKINLEIHTRENWKMTFEIKKVVEIEFTYPIIKRFKGEYNPVELGCDRYDFMDMLYLIDNPEYRDDERFSRADAYMEDLKKFDQEKTQIILKNSFENKEYYAIYFDEDLKYLQPIPLDNLLIDSTLYNATLIGENDYGSVYLHECNFLLEKYFKKVAVIIGVNPIESKAYRAIFSTLNRFNDHFVKFDIYNVNLVNKDKGVKLVEEFIIPHILSNDYDLVIDVHSNIQKITDKVEYYNYIYSPVDTDESKRYLDKLSNIKRLDISKPYAYQENNYLHSLTDNNIMVLYFESYSYEELSLTYDVSTKIINNIIESVYD